MPEEYTRLMLRRKVEERPHGGFILRLLDENELEVTRFEEIGREVSNYFAFLKPSEHSKQRFGIESDEILMMRLHSNRQQMWFADQARRTIHANNRLSRFVALIISDDPSIAALCLQVKIDPSGGYKTAYIGIPMADLSEIAKRSERPEDFEEYLHSVFRAQAFTVDHFDTRIPVPDDLFGRDPLVTQLEADLRQSGEGVALLGVRRIGKTSILRRVLSQLKATPNETWVEGYYDAQEDTISASSFTVFSKLAQSLLASATSVKAALRKTRADLQPVEHLETLIRQILRVPEQRVVLAIDEIEWLTPTPGLPDQYERGKEFLTTFGRLRALKQKYPSQLALIVCGLNDYLCEIPSVNALPNPGLDWFRSYYVTPLSRQESDKMLIQLGGRMGLEFEDGFLARLYDTFSGHAYLLRRCCSVAASHVPRPGLIKKEHFSAVLEEFLPRAEGIFDAIVHQNLGQFYPSEVDYLSQIAADAIDANCQVSTEVTHLRRYGLISDRDGRLIITQHALTEFLGNHPSRLSPTAREVQLLHQVGRGATGAVWKALDKTSNILVAVKIYDGSGSGHAADTEFAILESLRRGSASEFVPAPIRRDRCLGHEALVMEWVEGETLETILASRNTIVGNDLVKLSDWLFAGIQAIHPPLEKIGHIQRQTELNPLLYEEVQRLLSQGMIHRDLKPANIMVMNQKDWQLRILDFGIATKAGIAAMTRVGTPDYLPPDWGVERWNVTFDLFALGRILWRCVAGALNEYGEIEARITELISDDQYRKVASKFFLLALAQSTSRRFRSAEQMRAAWGDALLAFID